MSDSPHWRLIPEIQDAIVFRGWVVPDERGFFSRTLDGAWLTECGVEGFASTQDSVSRSHKGVVRGLHVRKGDGEAKLVRCALGLGLRCARRSPKRIPDLS